MDITERKLAEEGLRKAQAELAHATRVMTMGELVSSIAHEVNQPLAAIATYGNACLRFLSGDPPNLTRSRQAIESIVSDSIRAGEVIQRIRALVKRTGPEHVRLDINEVVREVVHLARTELLNRKVSLQLELQAELQPVEGDRVQLQQVVLNLVLNGVEAMSAVTEGDRRLVIRSGRDDPDKVCVTVQDSGVGLSPQDVKRIFDAFYTTKSEGLGLGLSISRTIIEHHGGNLWAEPNPGPGATIKFTLPALDRSVG